VITLDGRRLTAAEGAVARLTLSLGLGTTAHDHAELILWPGSKLAAASPGASLTLALGEAGDEEDVFRGEVSAVGSLPGGVVLEGLGATVALSRAYRSQTYLRQSVGAIVRDLAGEAPIDEVEADTRLDVYSVDDRRPVWAHLADLARLAGCEVSAGPSGGLRFLPPREGAPATLGWGADVLAWDVASSPPPPAPLAAALGAASEQGAERWHWLRHDPVADPGATPTRLLAPLRTRDAAESLGGALAARAARAGARGTVRLVGRPDLRPGDRAEVADLPPPDPGPLRILAVEHLLDGRRGFVTTLTVEAGGGGGAASLLGGLGL
jgi:hypothetical protein